MAPARRRSEAVDEIGSNVSKQLRLAGMPRRLYLCTPTRLTTWLDCPRRYWFSYLARPMPAKGPPWAHNSLGASVHVALADWWRLPHGQRTPVAAGALVTRRWVPDGFRDVKQSAHWRERAANTVERYTAALDPADEPLGVERTVATRTGRLALSGRIDRLDQRGDEVVVVDYKTGRRTPTIDDVRGSLPLAVYAVAAERAVRRRCRRVELHHLPTGQVLSWQHSEESLARHIGRAEEIAAECATADAAGPLANPDHLADADRDPAAVAAVSLSATAVQHNLLGDPKTFPPRPSPGCGWCDWVRLCPEGRMAAVPRQPWDGLDSHDHEGSSVL